MSGSVVCVSPVCDLTGAHLDRPPAPVRVTGITAAQ